MVILYLIYLGAAPAQAQDPYDIYLKGQEGERMISCSDLACATFREDLRRIDFKLKPEAQSRARRFVENNRGIKANLIACGKPLAFHLDSLLSGKEALVSLGISKDLSSCVKGAAKALPACESEPQTDIDAPQ